MASERARARVSRRSNWPGERGAANGPANGVRRAGVRRASGADGEGVLAADAVAEAGDVGAVDAHGDGHGIAGVTDAVDLAARGEALTPPAGFTLRPASLIARPLSASAKISSYSRPCSTPVTHQAT